jgi:DNA-binding GntR family transcriptional regulator
LTGNPVLARYVSEVASRCGLILALYSRPHLSECAVSEHRAIIASLASGDRARAIALMDQHLDAVADCALIVAHAPKARDIKDIARPTPPGSRPRARPPGRLARA